MTTKKPAPVKPAPVEAPYDELAAHLPGAVITHAEPGDRKGVWKVTVVRTRWTGETVVYNGQPVTDVVEVSLS